MITIPFFRKTPKQFLALSLLIVICSSRPVHITGQLITTYGAVGDNKPINTTAIQTHIDEASEKGEGKVIIPAGIFLSGTAKGLGIKNFTVTTATEESEKNKNSLM